MAFKKSFIWGLNYFIRLYRCMDTYFNVCLVFLAPSLSAIKEDISAFSNLENTPFSLTKTPFSLKMRSF